MNGSRIPRGMRGVSLIELMISLAIGLVVVGAVLVTFVDWQSESLSNGVGPNESRCATGSKLVVA